MGRVYIVTDSSASVPEHVARELDIVVAPVLVDLEDQTYEDGIDLTPEEFYEKAEAGVTPRTSGPTVGHFVRAFESVPDDAEGILCITLPSTVSVTYASAETAAQTFASEHPDVRIEVIGLPVALGATGLIVMELASLAQRGALLDSLLARTDDLVSRAGIYIALDTVRYLIRGGRLGRLAGWLAGRLSIRPILRVVDGEVKPVARVRSMRRALDTVVEMAAKHIELGTRPKLMVLHAIAPERAELLKERLEELFEPVFTVVEAVGPALGTHSGPGAVGIAFLGEPEEGWVHS